MIEDPCRLCKGRLSSASKRAKSLTIPHPLSEEFEEDAHASSSSSDKGIAYVNPMGFICLSILSTSRSAGLDSLLPRHRRTQLD
jgi:hypothetical protein